MDIKNPEIETFFFFSIIYCTLKRNFFFATVTITQTFNLRIPFVCTKPALEQSQENRNDLP